jgi:predicted nuclease with TOPRIM domain
MAEVSLKVVALMVLAWSLAFCGPAKQQQPGGEASSAKQIGTDLPDSGSSDPQVKLYYVVDGRIFRGLCEGRDTVIPECGIDVESMTYGVFRERLDGGLSQMIRDLTEEAQQIRTAMAFVEHELQGTIDAINDIEQQSGHLSAELKELRAKMTRFENTVAAYNEQLALINQALQDAIADADLLAQRLIVIDALTRYRAQLDDIGARIPVLLDQIQAVHSQVADLRIRLNALNIRLSNLNAEMAQVDARLRLAYDDFSVYESTLRKLNSGIVYTVLSDNVIAQKERQFIKRFEKIFSGGA